MFTNGQAGQKKASKAAEEVKSCEEDLERVYWMLAVLDDSESKAKYIFRSSLDFPANITSIETGLPALANSAFKERDLSLGAFRTLI